MSGAGAGAGSGAGAVVRQGHLRKLKTMKKKFFVLRAETPECSARLEYYESEKKFKSGAPPRRTLALKSCYNIMRRLDLKQKHVIALFTREEQFCIVADNEPDLHAWLSAILKQHRADDNSVELLHPIQHVWQVQVQKKGLGASKNIQGLYNLCLTDKTLTLVKIKSHNNVISDLGIPERVEYSLKNIRRCGDSECFFYMEVGRQTSTGAGELWMLSDDSNIAQSMHSAIYHAMCNCTKETEHERDHVVVPKGAAEGSNPHPRRQTFSNGSGRPALGTDAGTLRNRCDSMPSRACSTFEVERPPPRHTELEGSDTTRDEPDALAEWYRTPRIPEEPDTGDISRDILNMSVRGGSVQHSRTSSLGLDDAPGETAPDGYLPMAPGHDPAGGLVYASSGSVCSGTPSTDPRFSEYQLEPATSHLAVSGGAACAGGERPPRANSVGSRPPPRAPEPRHRAYSVDARHRPPPPAHAPHAHHRHPRTRASAEDLMELDFSTNSPAAKASISRTPPATSSVDRAKGNVDEYVDMSPRNAGYVEMRPGDAPPSAPHTPATPHTDGYVEMSYGRAATRPIAIAGARAPPPPAAASPDERRRRGAARDALGSQTIFPLSLESPASPPDELPDELDEDPPHHALSTVREMEEGQARDARRDPAGSPQYVTLARHKDDELACNPLANKTLARVDVDLRPVESTSTAQVVVAGGGAPVRFSVNDDKRAVAGPSCAGAAGPAGVPGALVGVGPLHYAALDLEPRRAPGPPAPRAYTKIDFLRSEKLHADTA